MVWLCVYGVQTKRTARSHGQPPPFTFEALTSFLALVSISVNFIISGAAILDVVEIPDNPATARVQVYVPTYMTYLHVCNVPRSRKHVFFFQPRHYEGNVKGYRTIFGETYLSSHHVPNKRLMH